MLVHLTFAVLHVKDKLWIAIMQYSINNYE